MQTFNSIHPYDPESGHENEKVETNVGCSVFGTVCLGCCCSVFFVIAFAAFIVGFVGLEHTRHATLDPMCPSGYWNSSLGLILSRVIFFIVFPVFVSCVNCCCGKGAAAACTTFIALCFSFSITVANTTITAGALNALNCTQAFRAAQDEDPLLIESGSLFIFVDWVGLILSFLLCLKRCNDMDEQ